MGKTSRNSRFLSYDPSKKHWYIGITTAISALCVFAVFNINSYNASSQDTNFFSFEDFSDNNQGVMAMAVIAGESAIYKDVINYTILPGDTLSDIAYTFDINIDTITWANNISHKSTLKTGKNLTILPVDGVYYKAKKEDTLENISKKYNIKKERILAQNNIHEYSSIEGKSIILPGAKQIIDAPKKTITRIASRLPAEKKTTYIPKPNIQKITSKNTVAQKKMHFVWPATGKITQHFHMNKKHVHRGIDIANKLNTPIVAAGSGKIIEAKLSGWNNGYGKYILIQHENGLKTRYAHLNNVLVKTGMQVKRGQKIANMGRTGKVYGQTGIHIHFEIINGKSVENPIAYLK
jgi:murein DD-endopeptidase MepM/ murein hydrolase activator NlpD